MTMSFIAFSKRANTIWPLIPPTYALAGSANALNVANKAITRLATWRLKACLESRMASPPKMAADVLGRRVVRIRRSVEGTLIRVGGPPSISSQPPNGPNHRADLAHTASYDDSVGAYQEVDRVNDQCRWRKEGAKWRIAANLSEDGLDNLEQSALQAVAALNRLLSALHRDCHAS